MPMWLAWAGSRRSYTTNEGLAHNSVQGLCLDDAGVLWICSWYGLERFDGYQFHCFRPHAELEVNSRFKAAYLLQESRQIVVKTLSEEYLAFSLDDYTYRRCSEELTTSGVKFQQTLTDACGNRWEEASMGIEFVQHEPTDYYLFKHPRYPYPRAFFEDRKGGLWIAWGSSFGSSQGEVVIYDRAAQSETVIHAGSAVYTIFEDSRQHIWLGTRSEGVVVLKPTRSGGYERYDYRADLHPEVEIPNAVFQVYEDRRGRIWLATLGGGLYVVEAGFAAEKLVFTVPDSYPVEEFPRARSLLEVGDELLVGTDNGLLVAASNLPTEQMLFTNLLQQNTLSGPARELIHLVPRDGGEVLISSFGCGIYAFDAKQRRFYPYAAEEVADQEAVYSMLETAMGDLWVVTQRRLLLYDRAREYAIRPVGEPLTLIETRPFRERDGACWFATTEGALCVPKHPVKADDALHRPIFFSEVVIRRAEHTESRLLSESERSLTISPDARDLSLRVSALRYGESEQIRYAWRLVGAQTSDWVEVERGNEVVLHDLKAGVWQLEVRSTDGSGRWLNNTATLQLEVTPLWYERSVTKALFLLVLILLLLSIGWLLFKVKRLRGMYDALLNSPMVVSMQTAMTEIKPEEALTESDRQFIDALNEQIARRIGSEQIAIEELAEALHVSRSVFYRRLKSVVGQSPVEYLKEYRMQQAVKLLEERIDQPVADIAYSCGFSSPQYFNNVFRKRYHMTPSEWRKLHLNKNYNP